jgi:hypothetical protein
MIEDSNPLIKLRAINREMRPDYLTIDNELLHKGWEARPTAFPMQQLALVLKRELK